MYSNQSIKHKYKSSAQLKRLSLVQLEGKFGLAVGMYATHAAITLLVNLIISALIPNYNILGLILSLATSFIATTILSLFQVGYTLFSLNIACGQPHSFLDLFAGFRQNTEKALIISLVVTALSYVVQFVTYIPSWLLKSGGNLVHLIWSVPLLLFVLVIYLWIALLFSQVYFLLLDFPSYNAGELLKTSCRIMKGHKMRFFYIQLSFIPLILLSLLTCGIGLFWVIPYQNMVSANFYLNLMNSDK